MGQDSNLPLPDLVPTGCGSGSSSESVPAKWVGSCLSQQTGLALHRCGLWRQVPPWPSAELAAPGEGTLSPGLGMLPTV